MGKKLWITIDVLERRYEAKGAKAYRKANQKIQMAGKKANKDWIGIQCEETKTCLNKNSCKRAHQL